MTTVGVEVDHYDLAAILSLQAQNFPDHRYFYERRVPQLWSLLLDDVFAAAVETVCYYDNRLDPVVRAFLAMTERKPVIL